MNCDCTCILDGVDESRPPNINCPEHGRTARYIAASAVCAGVLISGKLEHDRPCRACGWGTT